MKFLIQTLKSKHTSLKKCTNWAKLIVICIFFSRFDGTRGEKTQIFRTLVLNVDMNVAIDKSVADIDLKVETKDYESMEDEKDGT